MISRDEVKMVYTHVHTYANTHAHYTRTERRNGENGETDEGEKERQAKSERSRRGKKTEKSKSEERARGATHRLRCHAAWWFEHADQRLGEIPNMISPECCLDLSTTRFSVV